MGKINYVENGHCFSGYHGEGVRSYYREISQAEYDRLSGLSYKELDNLVESTLDQAVLCGYGYYGCGLLQRQGKYYLYINKGTSCD